jgi:hypothetical protein
VHLKLAFKGVSLESLSTDDIHVVSAGFEMIRANLNVVRLIRDLPDEELDQFLTSVKIQVFSFDGDDDIDVSLDETLAGLSSFDGTRLYLSKILFSYESSELARRTLEHELMHNLSRWGKDNPRLISPYSNKNLRSRNGSRMIEGGHFYEELVYDEVSEDPTPFCMSEFQIFRKLF